MKKGFLYVASRIKKYHSSAVYSALSLRDYWPEANITLVTQKQWVTEEDKKLFDIIITEEVPNHIRTKLWALNKTPYDLTCYLDADTYIEHEDIRKIFENHNENSDITITKARAYAASINPKFKGGELTDHCGLFIYNNKLHTLEFMKQWWLLYKNQRKYKWNWDTDLYPEYLRPWDMWTYWWLQNKTDYAIKRSYFPDPDARWNFVHIYKESELKGLPIVINHRPISI